MAKRPFHTIIPGFVTKDGIPWLSYGLMGGAMQPQGHAQILINLIDFKMNVQEAGDFPRIHHTGSSEPTGEVMKTGGILNLESQFPYKTIRALMRRGHRIQYANGPYGRYQAIKGRRTAFIRVLQRAEKMVKPPVFDRFKAV